MAKRGRDSCTESGSSPRRPVQLLLGPTHCTPDHVPPARKAPELTPAPAQPQPVVIEEYHSLPGSGSSTPLYDLAEFDSTHSSVARSELDIASVVPSDISLIVARITPLNPQGSQVSHL